MNMYEEADKYKQKGFVEIATDSGTGSTILVHQRLGKVVKINQDIAYNKFIEFANNNTSLQVPKFSNFQKIGEPPYEGNSGFTLVEMDLYYALDSSESEEYTTWITRYFAFKKGSGPKPDDDFGLYDTVEALSQDATTNSLCLDILKATNIMKKSDGSFVITDPYN
ncbi:hypothetical protein CFG65_23925 [Vibrio parahaemolyticus]|uniref:hypothetical protein n=1 Tax=Vibrio parahaemolyticus TaxID=670 RepID=UPI000C291602|nr:hypothetical protein [Vibrio parahaemolyticus]PJR17640.1 hypothetical protein CFG65_23925 [Vibrio parahaemolyticus]HAS6934185.1 hypothetical protein [Vibrio parahaemolyticus]